MRSLIPKTKKKLSAFFTDESGKISKENILSMGVGGMILAWFLVENLSASSHSDGPAHFSWINYTGGSGGHVSVGAVNTSLAGHANGWRNGIVNNTPTGWHLSAWHVSWTSHVNHANHGSAVGHWSYNTGDDDGG